MMHIAPKDQDDLPYWDFVNYGESSQGIFESLIKARAASSV